MTMHVDVVRARLSAASHGGARDASSQADRVHRALRRALLSGELSLTQRLTEEELAERFQTSRTPVRDALRRLETEGHLVRDGSAGLRPSMPRASTMAGIYEVRVVLEDFVVRRAAGREPGVDVKGLETLRDEWLQVRDAWPELAEDFELPEFVHADEGFHEAVARLSGNVTAERQLRDINERIRLLRIHDFVTEDRIETTIAEHLQIVDAIVDADVARATGLMRDHVQGSAAVVQHRVGQILAHMFDADGVMR